MGFSSGVVTLSHNSIHNNDGGVGLYATLSPVTLINNHISNNKIYGGVDINEASGTVTLNDNIISENEGGGITIRYSQGVVILNNNLIKNNKRQSENCNYSALACFGGGIFLFARSQAKLIGNTISGNWAN